VLRTVLGRAGLDTGDVSGGSLHAGGPRRAARTGAAPRTRDADLRYSAAMLREYGNLSSAFVFFVLEAALADDAPGGRWWLLSFGAGFSCYGALLRVQ